MYAPAAFHFCGDPVFYIDCLIDVFACLLYLLLLQTMVSYLFLARKLQPPIEKNARSYMIGGVVVRQVLI